jgi:peptidoglycan/LPS O-acetylase OafA/YrhL
MTEPRNNVGMLRLVFASAVIFGHAPEMIDGNRSREPLTVIFHSVSLGEVAVTAFFLLSGYLIAKSYLASQSIQSFLIRRWMRIVPAFVVAYVASVCVLGPLVSPRPWMHLAASILRLVLLQTPGKIPDQFPGLKVHNLNGSLWTIAYEFRAYMLLAGLGWMGFLKPGKRLILATGGAVAANLVYHLSFHVSGAGDISIARLVGAKWPHALDMVVGEPGNSLRLNTIFLVGSCFHFFERQISRFMSPSNAGIALVAVILTLFFGETLAYAGLMTFGAFALFYLAFHAKFGPLQRINDGWDVSYGVYLYGWPISTALIVYFAGIGPLGLAALTLPLAIGLGAASWWGLEVHARQFARRLTAEALGPA